MRKIYIKTNSINEIINASDYPFENSTEVKIDDDMKTQDVFNYKYEKNKLVKYFKGAESIIDSKEYTYTFGKYYQDEGIEYHCIDVNSINPKESLGKTFTSKFKPKYLVGRFFEVVS